MSLYKLEILRQQAVLAFLCHYLTFALGENIKIENFSFSACIRQGAPPGCNSVKLPLEPNLLVTHYPTTYKVIIIPMLTLTV